MTPPSPPLVEGRHRIRIVPNLNEFSPVKGEYTAFSENSTFRVKEPRRPGTPQGSVPGSRPAAVVVHPKARRPPRPF